MSNQPIILSIDPGKLNFAYSLMTLEGKLIKTGVFPNAITELKDPKVFTLDVKNFIKEVQNLTTKPQKFYLVFERFVPRGSRYMGNLIEITCMKIGIMLSSLIISNDVRIIPILASSWKNFFNKKNLKIENDSAPEHILDAICIGLYYLIQSNRLTISQIYDLTKYIKSINFNWYCYKSKWYFGTRKEEHLRGRKNSFGN